MPKVALGPEHDMPYLIATAAATAQTATVVTGVAANVIRVYAVILSASANTVASLTDSASSTGATTGNFNIALNSSLVLPNTGIPWSVTAPGAGFQVVNSVTTLGITVYYTIDKFY